MMQTNISGKKNTFLWNDIKKWSDVFDRKSYTFDQIEFI